MEVEVNGCLVEVDPFEIVASPFFRKYHHDGDGGVLETNVSADVAFRQLERFVGEVA